MLCFAGGGIDAPGRLMFDANGNLWRPRMLSV
jgi:hypothetical protein